MIRIREALVVEGRYDKNTLSQIVDTVIIETNGFGIFSDKEKLSLLRRIADERGIVVFTDSDGAGFVIRNYLKGSLGPNVKHAYIPDIFGREKRKRSPSAEGKLGVEGMDKAVLIEALVRAGVSFTDEENLCTERDKVTKADLYVLGLSGGKGSAEKRRKVLKKAGLPEHLSANAFLDVINVFYGPDELKALVSDAVSESDRNTNCVK